MCLGTSMVLPLTAPYGAIGFWSFDDSFPTDSSGNAHHAEGNATAGPAFRGSSLLAGRGTAGIEVAPTARFDTPDFAYTFWLFVQRPSEEVATAGTCTLVRKGTQDAASPLVALSDARRLVVRMTTTSGDETLTSFSRLRFDGWYHVSLVRLGAARQMRLYVNGVLDTEQNTDGYTESNEAPLYIGSDPWNAECGFGLYLDEVRAYDRMLEPDEIGAEAAPVLGGVEAAYLRLGCTECTLDSAMNVCPESYHICTALELHTEAYRVAKTLGWITPGMHVWTHATESNAAAQAQGGVGPGDAMQTGNHGLGLCCLD